jgi:hypothetical protein
LKIFKKYFFSKEPELSFGTLREFYSSKWDLGNYLIIQQTCVEAAPVLP